MRSGPGTGRELADSLARKEGSRLWVISQKKGITTKSADRPSRGHKDKEEKLSLSLPLAHLGRSLGNSRV